MRRSRFYVVPGVEGFFVVDGDHGQRPPHGPYAFKISAEVAAHNLNDRTYGR